MTTGAETTVPEPDAGPHAPGATVATAPVKPRGRHHVKWVRVPILAVAGVVGFFVAWEACSYVPDDLYGRYVKPQLPALPYRTGEWQRADDIPGFLDGVDNADDWYGYEPAKYALYLPPDRTAGSVPLMVCLHGAGDEESKYLTQGLAPAIRKQIKETGKFPFAVLFPRAKKGRWEPETDGAENLLRVLDRVVERHGLDPKRVYLTGWSSGGSGVWALAEAYPERWAAIVPLCATPTVEPKNIKDTSCWIFLGGADKRVSVLAMDKFIGVMWGFGSRVKCTVYPKVAHNVWDEAYKESELHEWLLLQRLR